MNKLILEKVLLLNPNADGTKMKFEIETAVDEVLSYCNLETLPTNLVNTIAKYLVECSDNARGVTSISEGDTSITYKDNYSEGIVEALKGSLNRYRKMRTL